MTTVCECCGQPLPDHDPVAQLRAWCEEHGHHVTPDGAVYEDAAAAILDRAPGTLRNWRGAGGGMVPFHRHGRTGRVRYRLSDLAELLAADRYDE